MATSDKRRQAEDNREGHVGRATITIDGEHEDAPPRATITPRR